jgi:hypothetical protein
MMDSMTEVPLNKLRYGWREPAALILDEGGIIRDCNNTEELFGYKLRELLSQHISKLLPQLAEFELIQDGQFNPRFSYLCRCGHLFKAQSQDGDTFLSELDPVSLARAERRILKLYILPSRDQGYLTSFG